MYKAPAACSYVAIGSQAEKQGDNTIIIIIIVIIIIIIIIIIILLHFGSACGTIVSPVHFVTREMGNDPQGRVFVHSEFVPGAVPHGAGAHTRPARDLESQLLAFRFQGFEGPPRPPPPPPHISTQNLLFKIWCSGFEA